ncbi:amino acid adenylation domain-containing protein [Sorangium sp. So ce131]|uniref:amino acid adenylation domain-containing protein n=1 Tax=Sorangium sp. So ce131 TaxID=3133282 RepID=UPI003F5E2997
MATKLSDFSSAVSDDEQLISRWNQTGISLNLSKSVVSLFNERAKLSPDAVACMGSDGGMTYRELNGRANQIAHYLIRRGVGADVRVGLFFERSADQLVGMLAVLKAGGCYVPLDPQYPPDYVHQIVTDAEPILVLSGRALGQRLRPGAGEVMYLDDIAINSSETSDPRVDISPEQLSYVMYTSGSTGLPKGVMVPHRQLVNWLYALWDRVPFEANEVVAQKTSTAFAISVKELLAGLLAGVPQVFVDEMTTKDIPKLVRELERYRVTRLYTFPSQLDAILSYAQGSFDRLRHLRHLFVSIEPCPTELLAKVRAAMPCAVTWYIYGCTEINDVTYCDPANQVSSSGFVPIGRPIRNTRVFVLDEDLRAVPVGAIGEIYVESVGVARGYWRQPELTAERFIPNPHGEGGSRLYRTGDLARYLADGSLEFLGRRDQEVKIRGYRVDLRQVEKVIAAHPDIQECAVVGWRQGVSNTQLVAYLVWRSDGAAKLGELREYLSGSLPSFMVPGIFQSLPGLPRLPNGKLDRLSLPEPSVSDSGVVYQAPRTKIETTLARIWSEVLTQGDQMPPTVGIADDFFSLGGHSLLATQLFSRVRQEFELELPINTLFEYPVLESFAKAVDIALAERTPDANSRIAPADRGQPVPLSYVQERLWFVNEHMEEQRTSYNVAFSYRMRGGGLSIGSLRAAVNGLVARHETLRTTFVVPEAGGQPVQCIAEALWIDVPLCDVKECDVAARVAEHAGHVFDLAKGPLLNVTVLRVAPDDHVFMMNMHHIICDGWSIGILFRDLQELYTAAETGAQPSLPELPVQYADYAVWQRHQDLSSHLASWKETLEGYEEGLALPYDYSRPANRAWRAGTYRFQYSPELAAQVAEVSRSHQATVFMTLVASVAVVLYQYTGREDLCLGTTVAGRDQIELEGLIGFFVNILALRIDLSGNPTAEVIMQRTRARVLAAMEHRDLPFEHVLAALQKQRDSSQIALVPVMVRHQNFPTVQTYSLGRDLGGGQLEFGERTTPSELDLQFSGDGSFLEVTIEYAKDLFTENTIERLVAHHREILETLVGHGERRLCDFPLLTQQEQDLYAELNDTACRMEAFRSLADRFESQVNETPDALACISVTAAEEQGSSGARRLSYGRLNARANQVAHGLRAMGVGPESRVAVICDRSQELLIAVVAILKTGGCYVPVDPQYPQHYIEQILEDAAPQAVLSKRALQIGHLAGEQVQAWLDLDDQENLIDERVSSLPQDNLEPVALPHASQLACLMYTSGSTGTPKGVMVPYAQIHNWLQASWRRYPFGPGEVMLQKTSISFAVSVKELLSGLLAGMPQVMLPDTIVKDSAALTAAVHRWQVTRIHIVPSHLRALLESPDETAASLSSLKYIVTAGEALPQGVREDVRRKLPKVALWNNYGCTELNDVTYFPASTSGEPPEVPSTAGVPIGKPISNTQVFVLDEQLRQVPVGVMGELHVDSIGMARGYWRQPDLTAERFVVNPYSSTPGARLYKTGDMVRFLADGSLEYLGRRDHEIKVRGHRVDVRQVESVVGAHPGVAESAVMGWPLDSRSPALTAYVVPRSGWSGAADELRRYLSERLPTYMVPTLYKFLPALPRLPNGKLDRLSLPAPEVTDTSANQATTTTETEKLVAAIWGEILKRDDGAVPVVGKRDNFFDLGGHSLLADRVLSRVHLLCGIRLSINALFEKPVMESFAKEIDDAVAAQKQRDDGATDALNHRARPAPVLLPIALNPERPSLFCIHPIGGQVSFYNDLAKVVGAHASVYGVQSIEARDFELLEELAAFYGSTIQSLQRKPTYRLVGWSSGGLIALAIARELEQRGCTVEYVGLIDSTPIPSIAADASRLAVTAAVNILGAIRGRGFSVREIEIAKSVLASHGRDEECLDLSNYKDTLLFLARHFDVRIEDESSDYLASRMEVTKYYLSLLAGFKPEALGPNVYLYKASERLGIQPTEGASAGWNGGLESMLEPSNVIQVPGTHYTMLQKDNVHNLGARINERLMAINTPRGAV